MAWRFTHNIIKIIKSTSSGNLNFCSLNHACVSIEALLQLQGNSVPRTCTLQALGVQLRTRRELSVPSTRRLRGSERLHRRCLVGGPTRSLVRRRDCRSPREFQFRSRRRRWRPELRRFKRGVLGWLQFGEQFPNAKGNLQGARQIRYWTREGQEGVSQFFIFFLHFWWFCCPHLWFDCFFQVLSVAVYNHYKRIFNETSLPKWLVLLFFAELYLFLNYVDCM